MEQPLNEKKTAPQSTTVWRIEKKRRRRELIIAVCAFFIVLFLSFVQLNKLYAGDRIFLALFNINFIILLGIFFVVIRNGLKLLLERRQRVLGSGLRARLSLAFLGLALIPCLIMLFITTKYVQISMDFWFKEQIETSMELALSTSGDIYQRYEKTLVQRGKNTVLEINSKHLFPITSKLLLQQKRKEYGATFIGITDSAGTLLVWDSVDGSPEPFLSSKGELPWVDWTDKEPACQLVPAFQGDFLFCLVPLYATQQSPVLIFADNLGAGFKARVDRVAKGVNEYKILRNFKRSLKGLLYSSLAVLTGFIMLGAIWLAFRLAREISAPVLAVAQGAKRIAQGDLSVRLEEATTDELRTLVRSFNIMAQDLETSRQEIIGANYKLEQQNIHIIQHRDYIETILNNITAGILSFDINGIITTANKAALEILALPRDVAIGKTADDIFDAPFARQLTTAHQQFSKKEKKSFQDTFLRKTHDEEKRLVVTSVSLVTDNAYSGAVTVIEDVSELERMQRMAAWREVARRIAHEIKNPLTPIKLSAERLARKFGSQVKDPAFTQSTKIIVDQVAYLQNMVQEFSAFAKLPEVQLVEGDITKLITSTHELFKVGHQDIQWELQLEENLPRIPLDAEALNRAFINLYTNAVEALALTNVTKPFVRTIAKWNKDLNLIKIDVENNGPVVSKSQLAQIFEPYFSHKEGGTGLGLTIVRSIIADHHGYVRALPYPGGGLTISMELPLP